MARNTLILIVLMLCSAGNLALGQNTMNYLNGKIVEVNQYEINGEKVVFVKTDDKKQKEKKVSKYKIFSIVDSNGSEEVVYTKDTTVYDEMNQDEMRHFMLGEQFARAHYKNNWNKVGGLASGLTGGLIGFYGLPVPLFYSIVNERVSPPIKYPKNVELPKAVEHEYFQYGYQKRSASKKTGEIFLFGGIGLAIGITTFIAVFDN